MQKFLLAKQEAEAYIRGRFAAAESATGIIQDLLLNLNKKGIELSTKDRNALVVHLTYMICHQNEMALNISKIEKPLCPLIMQKN